MRALRPYGIIYASPRRSSVHHCAEGRLLFTLRLLGGLTLAADGGVLPPAATQRRRLALLALLAVAGPRGVSRARLTSLLWPESTEDRARHALEQLIYATRRDLSREAVAGDLGTIAINPAVVRCDLTALDEALARGDDASAVAPYEGPFLDGVVLPGAVEFEQWVDAQRAGVRHRVAAALDRLAAAAELRADFDGAVRWRRQRLALDALDAEATCALIRALVASGNVPGARIQARLHHTLRREELGADPDPRVIALDASIVTESPFASAPLIVTLTEGHGAAPPVKFTAGAAPISPASRRSSARWQPLILPVGVAAAIASLLVTAVVGGHRETADGRAAMHAASGAGAPNSVAVLPLEALDGDPETRFVGDGLAEELTYALGRTPGLAVVARTSAFAYRGREVDLRSVGRELGVRTVLEGSVRRAGDRVRIVVRLVDARTGYERWSEEFDRDFGDMLAVQDEIARAVVSRVVPGGDTAPAPAERRAPVGSEAYQAYLRGRYALQQGGSGALAHAVEVLEASTRADATFAPAWAALAGARLRLYETHGGGAAESALLLGAAEQAVRRALALDATFAEGHATLGSLLLNRWDWAGADSALRRAVALNPSDADAHRHRGVLLALRGRFEDAVREVRRAEELDPMSFGPRTTVAYVLGLARRYPEAEAQLRVLIAMDSTRAHQHFLLGWVLTHMGRYPEAERELQTAASLAPASGSGAMPMLGYALARAGRRDEAMQLRGSVEAGLRVRAVSPYFAVAYFAAIGDHDRAFGLLSELGRRRESCLRDLAVDPTMDALRGDPRFHDALRAVALQ